MNPEKRNTLQFKVITPDMEKLKELVAKLPGCFRVTFERNYGKILDLLSIKAYPKAIIALAQFYDLELLCFLFRDFQLTPTLEEFENFLMIPFKGKMSYHILAWVRYL